MRAWLSAILGAALAFAAAGAIWAYGQEQFTQGETAERAVWLGREYKALQAAQTRIATLETQARAQEQQHAQDMADASAQFQKELTHERASKDLVIADLRSGALRLRVPVASTACASSAGGSGPPAPGASAAGRDGEARAELSATASEFLVGLATEADEVVHQLAACQAVVTSDREQQGGR